MGAGARETPCAAGMGQKAARGPCCRWQEQAGTPWDLTPTRSSWFPGGIALGRAAQPSAKTLVFIANKGQARPRKSCRFLRHAGSSSLGGRSLRSPWGVGARLPAFLAGRDTCSGRRCGAGLPGGCRHRPLLPRSSCS